MDNRSPLSASPRPRYELRFEFLFHSGRALAFPCDAGGRVDVSLLSDKARSNYAYAQSAIGRELAMPDVQLSGLQ